MKPESLSDTSSVQGNIYIIFDVTWVRVSSLQPPDGLREVGVGCGGTLVNRGFKLSGLTVALASGTSSAVNYKPVRVASRLTDQHT